MTCTVVGHWVTLIVMCRREPSEGSVVLVSVAETDTASKVITQSNTVRPYTQLSNSVYKLELLLYEAEQHRPSTQIFYIYTTSSIHTDILYIIYIIWSSIHTTMLYIIMWSSIDITMLTILWSSTHTVMLSVVIRPHNDVTYYDHVSKPWGDPVRVDWAISLQ